MRLNGWQRLGIVASFVWFLAGGFWGNNMALNEASKLTSLQLDSCVASNRYRLHLKPDESGPYDQIWTPCWEQLGKNYLDNVKGHWWAALVVGLGPIPFAWLIAWALVAIYRWIKRGFDSSN